MLTFEHDMSIRERKAEERGIAIGEKRGRLIGENKGRIESRTEMIKTMASNNMKPERIAKVTNISLDEVKRILDCL